MFCVYLCKCKSSWLLNILFIFLFAVHMTCEILFVEAHEYVTGRGMASHDNREEILTTDGFLFRHQRILEWWWTYTKGEEQIEITVMWCLFMAFSRKIQLIIVKNAYSHRRNNFNIAQKRKNMKTSKFRACWIPYIEDRTRIYSYILGNSIYQCGMSKNL